MGQKSGHPVNGGYTSIKSLAPTEVVSMGRREFHLHAYYVYKGTIYRLILINPTTETVHLEILLSPISAIQKALPVMIHHRGLQLRFTDLDQLALAEPNYDEIAARIPRRPGQLCDYSCWSDDKLTWYPARLGEIRPITMEIFYKMGPTVLRHWVSIDTDLIAPFGTKSIGSPPPE